MAKKKSGQNHQDRIKEEHFIDRLFLLHLKKSLLVIILWVAFMILAGYYDGFFDTISVYIIPAYLLVSIIYTLSKHRRIEGKGR